jgi:CheY-like chemotaxis protein
MIHLILVDDDDINNFLFNHLLKKSDFDVQLQMFTNPVEALDFIKKCFIDGKKIDLVLLDINMPMMSGWEVLDDLRSGGESLLKNTNTYMLSSSVHTTDTEMAGNYPEVSGFISKPIGLDQLSGIFKEITERNLKL